MKKYLIYIYIFQLVYIIFISNFKLENYKNNEHEISISIYLDNSFTIFIPIIGFFQPWILDRELKVEIRDWQYSTHVELQNRFIDCLEVREEEGCFFLYGSLNGYDFTKQEKLIKFKCDDAEISEVEVYFSFVNFWT